ncbi:MAG: cellulase family glycosylhydrolase [Saprospiraceae bacterium]|nr:cellulase family glycosylhydrolase [Saprospiraceae bacterium]
MLLILGASNLIAFFKTGSTPVSMLNTAKESPLHAKINWITVGSEGREMEAETLEKISRDYQNALKVVELSKRKGNQPEFNDYLTNRARITATASILSTSTTGVNTHLQPIEHYLDLKFYAADGSMVVFEDSRLSVVQVHAPEGSIIVQNYDSSRYHIMMLLEDNFWRIRHMKRSANGEFQNGTGLKNQNDHFIRTRHNTFMLDSLEFFPKGINYYPSDHPWELFWSEFDPELVVRDFITIGDLGLNTIRIFIPYLEFGGAEVSSIQIDKLKKVLDLADQQEIKVIVTLFDFFLDYDLDQWNHADRHLETLLSEFRDHPAIFAWDIKNEPDLDFDSRGKTEVISWLDFILKRARNYDPNHLLSIGWSDKGSFKILWDQVDFSSFHFYQNPTLLAEWLETEQISTREKPVFLGEFGRHTYKSWWYPIGNNQKDQNRYLEDILDIIEAYDLPYAIWTLYDFNQVPDHIAGSYPWRKYPQERYGLIDKNQKHKKAYKTLKTFNKNSVINLRKQ